LGEIQIIPSNTSAVLKMATFERPTEIDNSDIEGEHPG